MTKDATMVSPGFQIKQAGDAAITGGSTLDVSSSSYLRVESGGVLAVDNGGQISLPFTAATTSANISNFGISTLSSTVANGYTMNAPDQPGLLKVIGVVNTGSSANDITVACGAPIVGATTEGSNPTNVVFDEPGSVTLMSSSAGRWVVLASYAVGTVTFTS